MADPPREFAHLGPHRNRIIVLPCSTIMRSTSGFCRLIVISPTVSDPFRIPCGDLSRNRSTRFWAGGKFRTTVLDKYHPCCPPLPTFVCPPLPRRRTTNKYYVGRHRKLAASCRGTCLKANGL